MKRLLLKILMCIFLVAPTMGVTFLDPVARKNEAGNALFEQGEYEGALRNYLEAQQKDPNRTELHFNIGAALYELRRYDEAAQEFKKAVESSRDTLKAFAYYNLGNTFFRQEKFEKAFEVYKEALHQKPDDLDTKINLEITQGILDVEREMLSLAKNIRKKAEFFVSQNRFSNAYELMVRGLPKHPKVQREHQDFIRRLKDIVDIEDGQ